MRTAKWRVEKLYDVSDDKLKKKADDAIQDKAVKFKATKNKNGNTWTVKTTFKVDEQ